MWKQIPALGGRYEASTSGEIRHIEKKNIRKARKNKCGYLQMNFSRCDGTGKSKTILVHKLIAMTFLENPNNLENINHIDGNKQNNAIENLEYCTRSENLKHAFAMGLHKARKGEESPRAKLTNEQAQEVRKLYREKRISQQKIAGFFNVSQRTVSKIVNGKRYASC